MNATEGRNGHEVGEEMSDVQRASRKAEAGGAVGVQQMRLAGMRKQEPGVRSQESVQSLVEGLLDRAAIGTSDGFEEFRAAYPASRRNVKADRAERAWRKLTQAQREKVMAWLPLAAQSPQWSEACYIPHMATVIHDPLSYWESPRENWVAAGICPECLHDGRQHLAGGCGICNGSRPPGRCASEPAKERYATPPETCGYCNLVREKYNGPGCATHFTAEGERR